MQKRQLSYVHQEDFKSDIQSTANQSLNIPLCQVIEYNCKKFSYFLHTDGEHAGKLSAVIVTVVMSAVSNRKTLSLHSKVFTNPKTELLVRLKTT